MAVHKKDVSSLGSLAFRQWMACGGDSVYYNWREEKFLFFHKFSLLRKSTYQRVVSHRWDTTSLSCSWLKYHCKRRGRETVRSRGRQGMEFNSVSGHYWTTVLIISEQLWLPAPPTWNQVTQNFYMNWQRLHEPPTYNSPNRGTRGSWWF